eukprot:TRINITY_DN121016_c0_g1_i1.p1 TRINITY_DN121016_c0_g1~~TRINITY_DN121016_c0_g1_i1.p1  ORF type:complete len:828 (-),score=103.60 TRINITY_DN121016_c0_g1_i1:7-2490(-)
MASLSDRKLDRDVTEPWPKKPGRHHIDQELLAPEDIWLEGASNVEQKEGDLAEIKRTDSERTSESSGITLFGLKLDRVCPHHKGQLVLLYTLSLCSSLAFAALQERVLYVPGFRYMGLMSILTSGTYVVFAFLQRLCLQEPPRAGPLTEYAKLSVLCMGGMYLTNWSLRFLSYPLRIVFKSSKVLPVMLLSALYVGKRYSFVHWVSALLLSAGLVLFTLGDSKGRATFDPRGLVLISIGSLCESFAATFEEKVFFATLGCPASEVVMYSNFFGFLIAVLAEIAAGDFRESIHYCSAHPEALVYIIMAAIAGCIAQNIVLILIKHYGALITELVKSSRKMFTISISFCLYGKPWTTSHLAGGLLFLSSVVVERWTAGGSSRRIALGMTAAAGVGTLLLLSGPGPSTYSVVIDAGSTGTRLHVFRFDAWTSRLLDVDTRAQAYITNDIPLASVVGDPDGVQKCLAPLIDAGLEAIPLAQRALTPLALRGTAALRVLPPTDADHIMSDVRAVLKTYPFKAGSTSVMDGQTEARYLWLAVNYLMGTFRPGVQAIEEPLAVVDMRGGSLQIVYLIEESQAKAAERLPSFRNYIAKVALPLGSGYAHVYQHSFLGYGLLAARSRVLEAFTQETSVARQKSSDVSKHPCLPFDAEVEWRYSGTFSKWTGSMDGELCRVLVREMLNMGKTCGPRDTPVNKGCSFDGAWAGPGIFGRPGQRLLLAAYFFDRLRDSASDGDDVVHKHVTLGFLEGLMRGVCALAARGLKDLMKAYPRLSRSSASWLCFDMEYIVALLHDGFRLDLDRQLLAAREIGQNGKHFPVSWALGVSIDHLPR